METENEAYMFYKNLPVSEKKDYKLVYDFRVKNASGIYMRLIHQFIVLEQDKFGKSLLAHHTGIALCSSVGYIII